MAPDVPDPADNMRAAKANAGASTSAASQLRGRIAAILDSDIFYSFSRSRLVVAAALLTALLVGAAFLAPLIAPHNPYDLKSLDLLNADLPPAWRPTGRRPLPARHRRPGPRHPLDHTLRHTLVAADRHRRSVAGDRRRRHPWTVGRLCRWSHRQLHHARCRCPAHLSGHSDRAADRRRRAGRLQELPFGGRQILDPGSVDRARLLGTVCAHGARRDFGGAQQGVRRGGAADRLEPDQRSCSSTSCRMC